MVVCMSHMYMYSMGLFVTSFLTSVKKSISEHEKVVYLRMDR